MASTRKVATCDIDTFVEELEHSQKSNIVTLRRLIVDADRTITDGIKWNSLSFRTTDWFATINLRAKTGVEVILHFGAKKNAISETGVDIPDPQSLLKWITKDRASVVFLDEKDLASKRSGFVVLLREWIKHLSA